MSEFTVAISSDFFSAFASLPKTKQSKVMDFMSKFRSNPTSPGLNYEKINDAYDKNMRSVRVDDAYRAIVMRQEDSNVFLLLWVDHHDEAYDWARKKRCIVNHQTGSIQVYEASSVEASAPVTHTEPPMFVAISDTQLQRLGVPEELYPLVRSIVTEDDFYAAQKKMPRDAFEALEYVHDGFDVDEVVETLYGESKQGGDITTIETALTNPITLMQFTVVEGEEELKAMMNAPLEKWRVFLHPSQRRMVNKTYTGPARVLGGAGTGKTVVAMHRARHLAQQCTGNERILFTTFTANLAQDIKDNLRKICTTEEMKRIEVTHLDAWVTRFLKQQDYEYRIEYNSDVLEQMWDEAARISGEAVDSYPQGFFEEEWRTVVQAQGIQTKAEYVKASRAGRGTRLDRKGRISVWNVFEEYRTLMNVNRIRDSVTAMNECAMILQSQPEFHPYVSIVVDEAQDFGMAAFRLLRALAGEEHTNDLFIVGDAHQRIYKNKVTLSKCNINVRGRASQLRINYRTTEEIRDWAMCMLKGISFDDLDGGIDSGKGYRSLSHGDIPKVDLYGTADEECAAIIKSIQEQMTAGIDPKEICIVARTNTMLNSYKDALDRAGIDRYEIKRDKIDDRHMAGVRLATMHRVKGLEFTCVYLAGINKDSMPLKSAIQSTDADSKQEAMTAERCLLYVALTRAKKAVFVSGYGKPSPFLPA